MKYLRQILCLVVFVAFQAGCSSLKIIDRDFHAVHYSDGIDAREARAIAQRHYIRNNFDKNVMLSDPGIAKDLFLKDTWNVSFSTKGQMFLKGVLACQVNIDSKVGIIKGESCWPNLEEGI